MLLLSPMGARSKVATLVGDGNDYLHSWQSAVLGSCLLDKELVTSGLWRDTNAKSVMKKLTPKVGQR